MDDIDENLFVGDALCFVLAKARKKDIVYKVLNYFIPNYIPSYGYWGSEEFENLDFANDDEALHYLDNKMSEDCTIYWHQKENNPDGIMVGAHYTNDGYLIMSVTISCIYKEVNPYFKKLKLVLDSEIGVIYFNDFPPFANGAEFIDLWVQGSM